MIIMRINRLLILLLVSVFTSTMLLAKGMAGNEQESSDPNSLVNFTWGKNQFGMAVPEGFDILQETDSMVHIMGSNYEMYVVVEDRSVVTEASCAQYIFDDVKRKNGRFTSEPIYNLKERSVGCFYIGAYPHEELGECLMAETCLIDRMSRRIFTVAVFATHDYDEVIRSVIESPYILNEPYQY